MRQVYVLFIMILIMGTVYGQEKIIKSITLKEAIELGLLNNPTIKAAQENISASKGRYLSGIALPQPEISYDNQWIPVGNSLGNISEKTLSISQGFEFPSIYLLKGNKFSKAEEITLNQLNFIEKNLIKQIKTAYFKVLLRQYQVKLAEENLTISDDFLKKAEIRLNVGEGTNLEKLTAKVQNTEARNNLEIARNELKSAFAELNYILGYGKQEFDSKFNLKDSLIFVNYDKDIEKIYLEFETNPLIKIAELNTEIASIEKSMATSSYLPKINLAYLMQSRDNNNAYNGASIGISVPLWFMFEQKGKVQEASANLSISQFELQQTKNSTSLKLKNAITDFENNLKQVKLYTNEILPQSEEIFRTAIKSYDAGEITYIEYLQAEQTIISSRNNYNNSLFNYYQSLFLIEEIIGQNIISK